LGMGLFPLFAQLIIDLDGNNPDSWRMSWIFIGLMVWFISLPLVFFTMVDDPKQIDSKDKKYLELKNNLGNKGRNDSSISLKNALKTRPFWMLSMVGFLTYFIHTGVNIHQAAYLIDKGINPIFAASALTIMALGTGVGSLVTGWATDKFSSKIVYFFGCIWLGLSALLFLLISNIFLAYLIGFIFGMALGGLLVIPPVVLADIFGKDNIGSIRGYSEPFVSAGQAIGGISAGLIYDFTGSYTLSFPMFAFIALLACIFIIFSSNVKKNK